MYYTYSYKYVINNTKRWVESKLETSNVSYDFLKYENGIILEILHKHIYTNMYSLTYICSMHLSICKNIHIGG